MIDGDIYRPLVEALCRAPNLDFGLGRVVGFLGERLGARQVVLYGRSPGTPLLTREAAFFSHGRKNAPDKIRIGEGLFGKLALEFQPGRVRWEREDWASAPLYLGSSLVGLLLITHKEARSGELLGRLRVAAGLLGLAVGLHRLRVTERSQSRAQEDRLREELLQRTAGAGMVGQSAGLDRLRAAIAQAAPSRISVLITGESGCGKELVADLLHALSDRREGPLVKVSCAALSESLAESELFGHVRGAFTGAVEARPGYFARANGGTLFLDEIGEMPLRLQGKLLRVLQEGAFDELGGTRTKKVDVRIIAATNRDLSQEIREGNFRKDLFYRLNGFQLKVPSLRDRREDIPLLVRHFLDRSKAEGRIRAQTFDSAALQALSAYDWPGNIRELMNVVARASLLARGPILGLEHLPPELRSQPTAVPQVTFSGENVDLVSQVQRLEQVLIEAALARTGGKRPAAAKLLGLKLRSLRYLLRKHGFASTAGKESTPSR